MWEVHKAYVLGGDFAIRVLDGKPAYYPKKVFPPTENAEQEISLKAHGEQYQQVFDKAGLMR